MQIHFAGINDIDLEIFLDAGVPGDYIESLNRGMRAN